MTSALTIQSRALAHREPTAVLLLKIVAGLTVWLLFSLLARLCGVAMLFERKPKYARRGRAWGSRPRPGLAGRDANMERHACRLPVGEFPNLRNRSR